MDFENNLIQGIFIKRYKRFFVDVKVNNKIVTTHCPNPGSMLNLKKEGNVVWITKTKNQHRKLKYSLQIVEVENKKFCINTHITNKIINESLLKKKIPILKNFNEIKPEQKFGKNTRFDFLLKETSTNKRAFLEVKSVTLNRNKNHAEFPDAITTRGTKHLNNLILANKQGYESYIMFLVQFERCDSFGIASDIDPEYFKTLESALRQNVKIICYDCKFSNKGIEINKEIKIKI